MAKIETIKCDRCGRFSDHDRPIVVSLTTGRGPNMDEAKDHDLCDPCAEDLGEFLAGRKLSRSRRGVSS